MQFIPPPVAELSPLALINVSGWAWVIVAAVLLFGAPGLLRWLWNLTLPPLAQWPRLNYWAAFRLVLLVSLVGLVIRVF
ncbi:MAG: hypothetical protein C7B45_03785 [Sulfobacillus acidophilus]|uniref:Uncharacterized protein n=1 Tax=Sulfobacillus acidophilus TaxID=53633 RepID=A0A2T2WLY1_9FIRM|nr:MAG: hypothetical protein C7B45_03785 [Sulfobacillus acidophilus]